MTQIEQLSKPNMQDKPSSPDAALVSGGVIVPDFSQIDPDSIHKRLFEPLLPSDLRRPAHEQKEGLNGTVYIIVDRAMGKITPQHGDRCGAACANCYLIHGGVMPDYVPDAGEVVWMVETLHEKGMRTILTGAELLTRPDLFDAGLLDEKEYLLSSGALIAYNPQATIPRIAHAGIRNVQMSLHGPLDMPNILNGVHASVVEQAIANIREFNQQTGSYIGVALNVTVGNFNVGRLVEIGAYVLGNLNCDGLRFNRHKASGGKLADEMLPLDKHDKVDQAVAELRARFPQSTTGKRISLSGDFGTAVSRSKPYTCPAGLPGGEWTIVPQADGRHRVYACLEVRQSELLVGFFS
ncbi:MAG: hypothetical protein AAB874_02330, partial [Patescibacteria group bacterium]